MCCKFCIDIVVNFSSALNPVSDVRRGRHQRNMDAEQQTRAVEYGGLAKSPEVGRRNVLPLPHWDKRKSVLMRRLAEREVPPPPRPAHVRALPPSAPCSTAADGPVPGAQRCATSMRCIAMTSIARMSLGCPVCPPPAQGINGCRPSKGLPQRCIDPSAEIALVSVAPAACFSRITGCTLITRKDR